MKALLIKNDAWIYASGQEPKPEIVEGEAKWKDDFDKWIEIDEKAKAEIILSISNSKLKQIKNCETSSDISKKIEEIYQSKGPAHKTSLLKSLIQLRMPNSYSDNCIRDHLRKFSDIVDKLSDMEINTDDNLLTIML